MEAFVKFCAQVLPFAVPLIVVVVWLLSSADKRRSLLLRGFATGTLGAAFAWLAGIAFYDVRPFVRLHTSPLIPHVPDNGFPSDHTLLAAACGFVLMPYCRPAAYAAIVLAGIVGWARIESLLHSPLDVIASFVIAGLAALISKVLVRRKQGVGTGASPSDGKPPAQAA